MNGTLKNEAPWVKNFQFHLVNQPFNSYTVSARGAEQTGERVQLRVSLKIQIRDSKQQDILQNYWFLRRGV